MNIDGIVYSIQQKIKLSQIEEYNIEAERIKIFKPIKEILERFVAEYKMPDYLNFIFTEVSVSVEKIQSHQWYMIEAISPIGQSKDNLIKIKCSSFCMCCAPEEAITKFIECIFGNEILNLKKYELIDY